MLTKIQKFFSANNAENAEKLLAANEETVGFLECIFYVFLCSGKRYACYLNPAAKSYVRQEKESVTDYIKRIHAKLDTPVGKIIDTLDLSKKVIVKKEKSKVDMLAGVKTKAAAKKKKK